MTSTSSITVDDPLDEATWIGFFAHPSGRFLGSTDAASVTMQILAEDGTVEFEEMGRPQVLYIAPPPQGQSVEILLRPASSEWLIYCAPGDGETTVIVPAGVADGAETRLEVLVPSLEYRPWRGDEE